MSKEQVQAWYQDPFNRLNVRLKKKTRDNEYPFDLTAAYLKSIAVTHCPVLGIELSYSAEWSDNKATLDRVIPELGYVRSNVRFVSHRANRLKSDASLEELRSVLHYMEQHSSLDK
jgi:hypothetical protein